MIWKIRRRTIHEVQEQEDTTESLEETVFNGSEQKRSLNAAQLEEMVPAEFSYLRMMSLDREHRRGEISSQYYGYPAVKEMWMRTVMLH